MLTMLVAKIKCNNFPLTMKLSNINSIFILIHPQLLTVKVRVLFRLCIKYKQTIYGVS